MNIVNELGATNIVIEQVIDLDIDTTANVLSIRRTALSDDRREYFEVITIGMDAAVQFCEVLADCRL